MKVVEDLIAIFRHPVSGLRHPAGSFSYRGGYPQLRPCRNLARGFAAPEAIPEANTVAVTGTALTN